MGTETMLFNQSNYLSSVQYKQDWAHVPNLEELRRQAAQRVTSVCHDEHTASGLGDKNGTMPKLVHPDRRSAAAACTRCYGQQCRRQLTSLTGPEQQHPRRQQPPVGPRGLGEWQFQSNGQDENQTKEMAEDFLTSGSC